MLVAIGKEPEQVALELAELHQRLRAAGTLLDATLRWHELRSILQRLAAPEAQLAGGGIGDNSSTIILDV